MASKSVTRSLEMNSIFYDVLKLKKASKFKKYFDQYCYVACFEMLFFSLLISMPLTP